MALGSISAEDLSTIGGIATVSLLHSFIPTHWLPFSIVGRAQKWTLSRTLLVSTFLSLSLSLYTFFFPKLKASYAFLCFMHFINCMLVRDLVWTWQVEEFTITVGFFLALSPCFSMLNRFKMKFLGVFFFSNDVVLVDETRFGVNVKFEINETCHISYTRT